MNTYDWLSEINYAHSDSFQAVEVSFKNGSRKGFYFNQNPSRILTGDLVVVEAGNGYDIGRISLSGELVKLQMKKKRISEDAFLPKVVRKANPRDKERHTEARGKEQKTMVRARAIARSLGLEMKIGDVEYQGDNRKATFYYTAEGRVDFRELIRHYAKEFKIKVEMRQIGARQESARIGGLGSCGRELCCSTWLNDFKSVSTTAARYQNLAINQSKLSGQCGRLKCCLNYELDTYLDALEDFPKNCDKLYSEAGEAFLLKTDIFKGLMYYSYRDNMFSRTVVLTKERVKEVLALNKNGEKPAELVESGMLSDGSTADVGYGNVDGVIELPPEEKKKRRKRRNKKHKNKQPRDKQGKQGGDKQGKQSKNKSGKQPQAKDAQAGKKEDKQKKRSGRRRNRGFRKKKGDGPGSSKKE